MLALCSDGNLRQRFLFCVRIHPELGIRADRLYDAIHVAEKTGNVGRVQDRAIGEAYGT